MLRELLGHRGAAFEAPENTIAGFQYAWEAGVRSFELDIRLSADDQLVVLHDESLLRTAGMDRKVWEFSAAQLEQIETLTLFPNWSEKTGIPKLLAVLDQFAGRAVSWELEIKSSSIERMEKVGKLLVGMVHDFGISDRVVITSFDPQALAIVAGLDGRLRRGFISRYDQPQHLDLAFNLGCYRTCIPLMHSTRETVQRAHQMGFNVTGWLGDSEEMMETLLDWDVDAITTNRPTLALNYLRQKQISLPGVN